MASNNALSNALALASSKTNWTAIVPARAPPPPTPVKDIVGCCEKCAVEIVRDSDEHDNCHIIDGGDAADKFRCQRCLVDCPCDECDEDKAQCVLCSKWAVSATMSYDDAVGEHSCCDCDPKGDVLLGEEECSICGEEGEVGTITVCGRDIKVCENCDTDGDNYDGFLDKYEFCAETSSYEEKEEECCWEIDCDICGEKQGKDVCPFETGYADDEYVCDECFMCCGECSGSKNPAVGARYGEVCECEDVDDEHNRCIDCDEDFKQTKKTFWGCEVCGLNTCEECCKNDDGYVMCAGCVREKDEEVKKYKAVLAETLRFEAIMDMMKSEDA